MRTTIVLEDDVAAAVKRLRRERSLGLSEAVNTLIREGLNSKRPRRPYKHKSYDMGMSIDVTDIAKALELLEGPNHR